MGIKAGETPSYRHDSFLDGATAGSSCPLSVSELSVSDEEPPSALRFADGAVVFLATGTAGMPVGFLLACWRVRGGIMKRHVRFAVALGQVLWRIIFLSWIRVGE